MSTYNHEYSNDPLEDIEVTSETVEVLHDVIREKIAESSQEFYAYLRAQDKPWLYRLIDREDDSGAIFRVVKMEEDPQAKEPFLLHDYRVLQEEGLTIEKELRHHHPDNEPESIGSIITSLLSEVRLGRPFSKVSEAELRGLIDEIRSAVPYQSNKGEEYGDA